MGVERVVRWTEGTIPTWTAIQTKLAAVGMAVQMRMIDGELAFPDEQPPEGWRELRVAASGAMVTIRRGVGEVTLVGWGNMDAAQQALYDALAGAFAQ